MECDENTSFDLRNDQTIWSISSDGVVKDNLPEVHLKWLIEQIEGRLPRLRALQNTGGRAKITIHADSWSRLQALDMTCETMQFLARHQLGFTMIMRYQNTDNEF